MPDAAPRPWIDAIETALGPTATHAERLSAAKRAVAIARREGWRDNRAAFAYFALGRLILPEEPEMAYAAFLEAASIYGDDPTAELQSAHVAMQLAAFALTAGDARTVLRLIDPHLDAVADGENAALLASLLMMKAEALELQGREQAAREARSESFGWARYGFGTEEVVRARAAEISQLASDRRP